MPIEPPELDETPETIVQADADETAAVPPLPVTTVDPVQTRELPAKHTAYFTVGSVGTAAGVRLVPHDPRRKSVTVLALDQDVVLGGTQAAALSGAQWPANVPFVSTSVGEMWATSVTATTDVSVIAEYWTD